MKGKRKAFDRSLYDDHDSLARAQAKRLFSSWGFDVEDNPDQYGIDLILKKNKIPVFLAEVEVKNNWDRPSFPFSTVQLPERKFRYIAQYPGKVFFVIFSKSLEQAFVFSDGAVKDLIPVEVKNRFVANGERFYQVPISRCKLVRFDGAKP